jgi:hypothetical protein
MKTNKNIPTIKEISNLFIPEQYRQYFEVKEITPELIILNVKQDNLKARIFFTDFVLNSKIAGFEVKVIMAKNS